MDCEGYELEVLNGSKNLLKSHKPNLLVEITNSGSLMSYQQKINRKQKNYQFFKKIVTRQSI